MSKVLSFKSIYLFAVNERKAFSASFGSGRNIVSSSIDDGNKRGKSVLMKSLYHALGADCLFDGQWDEKNKIYILNFCIDSEEYFIYRHDKLFKIYNSQFEKIFITDSRTDLGKYFANLFNFQVELMDRDNALQTAPPAYSFILNYLDQDGMKCTTFSSFRSLEQFPAYKTSLLCTHLGVYSPDYFARKKQIENWLKERDESIEKQRMVGGMRYRIMNDLGDRTFSGNIEALQMELEQCKQEYSKIVHSLGQLRNELMTLRNKKESIQIKINELLAVTKEKKVEIESKQDYFCPFCHEIIENHMDARFQAINTIEDFFVLHDGLNISITEVEKHISSKEEEYRKQLDFLRQFESQLKLNSKEIDDFADYKGLVRMRDTLTREISEIDEQIVSIDTKIKSEKKTLKEYDEAIDKINLRYQELMLEDKSRFTLEEIQNDQLSKISKSFSVGGSGKPIATVVWYVNLLRLKNEFNPNAMKFPLVFDSPNNAELDDINKKKIFNFLFKAVDEKTQLIVSTLGFSATDYPDFNFENTIFLENPKYELLSSEQYDQHIDFLTKFHT